MIATDVALAVLPVACECDGEPSCAVCSCEEQSERRTPSLVQEEPQQLCTVRGKQTLRSMYGQVPLVCSREFA